MLSLANAASGTNLVEATHVVLIDPVAGSPEEAIAIDSQAIGRAHRMGQDKQVKLPVGSIYIYLEMEPLTAADASYLRICKQS